MIVFLTQFLIWSCFQCVVLLVSSRKTPYQIVRICNENDFAAAMYMKVQYREGSPFVWNLEETFPSKSCTPQVQVLTKVEYSITMKSTEEEEDQSGSETLKHFLKVTYAFNQIK
jgi:hypothetical protein